MFKTLKTIIAVAVTSTLLSTSLLANAIENCKELDKNNNNLRTIL